MMVIIDMIFWAFIDGSPSHIIIMILFCTIRMYEENLFAYSVSVYCN